MWARGGGTPSPLLLLLATLAGLPPATPAAPPEAVRGPGGGEEAVDVALALQADDECWPALREAGAPSSDGGCAVVAVQRAARVVLEGGEPPPAPPPGGPAGAPAAQVGTPAEASTPVASARQPAAAAAEPPAALLAAAGQAPPARPPSLGQLQDASAAALAAGRGLGEEVHHRLRFASLALTAMDSGTVTMICCLTIVPLAVAVVAFGIVEATVRLELGRGAASGEDWELLGRQASPLPRPPDVGPTKVPTKAHDALSALARGAPPLSPATPVPRASQGLPTSPPVGPRSGSLARIPEETRPSQPAQNGRTGSTPPTPPAEAAPTWGSGRGAPLRGPASLLGEGPGAGAEDKRAAADPPLLSEPPSLRDLSEMPASSLSIPSAGEEGRASPLSTALLVRNPSGVLVQLSGTMTPHPEQRTVSVVSVKDGTAILFAHAVETPAGEASIRVETKARNIQVAALDTRQAIYQPGHQPPSQDKRYVVLHRVASDDLGGSSLIPCAWVSTADGRFLVHYAAGTRNVALTVVTALGSPHIETMTDAQGQIVARSEATGAGEGTPALWVRQGMDMALVACIAVAVQKLS